MNETEYLKLNKNNENHLNKSIEQYKETNSKLTETMKKRLYIWLKQKGMTEDDVMECIHFMDED